MAMKVREKTHRLPKESYRGEVIASFTLCVEGRATLFSNAKLVTHLWTCLTVPPDSGRA